VHERSPIKRKELSAEIIGEMNGAVEVGIAVAVTAALPTIIYKVQFNRRRKDYLRFRAKRAGLAVGVYLATATILNNAGRTGLESIAVGLLAGISAGFVLVRPPHRSRTIPAHIKRAVIERDLKGVPFDAKLYHIDHIVPYSLDGDHSIKNLRVVPKVENLRRGARKPKLKELL
jgi:hypothetical protein